MGGSASGVETLQYYSYQKAREQSVPSWLSLELSLSSCTLSPYHPFLSSRACMPHTWASTRHLVSLWCSLPASPYETVSQTYLKNMMLSLKWHWGTLPSVRGQDMKVLEGPWAPVIPDSLEYEDCALSLSRLLSNKLWPQLLTSPWLQNVSNKLEA